MPHRNPPAASSRTAAPQAGDVRMGPLLPMAGVLRQLGHDPAAVCVASGLDSAVFDDPERRVPFHAAAGLIRRGAELSGRDDFGLLVGERFGVDHLGLLGQLMARARSVGEALNDLNRFLHLQDRGSVTFVRPAQNGVATLGYAIFDPDTPGVGLVYDLVMALAMRLMRGLAGPQFRATEVWLAHAAPRQRAPYRRVFGAPLNFDAPRTELHFAADWLQAPVTGGDAMQHELVRRAIREAEAGVAPSLSGRTRAAVRVLLMSGDASSARVADAMGLHERTLRRRLAAEGETLLSLLAQARFEVACQLLRETQLGLRDIADALGYAEAPVFVRAFRGWAGITPGQWRAQQLKPPAAP
jgi:AraC-like DNA-binding protein